jgi:hypothetical protein
MKNIPNQIISITPSAEKGRKRVDMYLSVYPDGEFTVQDIVAQSADNKYQTIFARIASDVKKGKLIKVGSRPSEKAIGVHQNIYKLKS